MPRKTKQPTEKADTPTEGKKRTRSRTPKAPMPTTPQQEQNAPTDPNSDNHSSLSALSTQHSALVEEFRARYPFPLDPFQEEAIAHLAAGESAMVAAPTGTGKTVVAEFGVFRAARQGFKVMYTTPIKALSNQKFRDLREQYGDAVGLLTGDIIENPEGSILVMTTEVLRNMLLQTPSALWGVGCVIFDEIHYLADPERGTTWEESIIMCPKYVQLVCLSATVTNAPEIADWIGRTHSPIHLVTHLQRAVPLSLYYYLDGQLNLVINAQGQQLIDFKVGGEAKKKMQAGRRYRGPVLGEEESSSARERPEPTPREIVEGLERIDLLPAIYFLFSRRDCEAAAEVCAMIRLGATRDPETMRRINEVLASYMDRLSPEDRKLEQVQLITHLARRGFGFHHAGLLPILKQLVEELFNKALMRVVFATDTLALGVNMPARSVVIGGMSKYDGVSRRPLIPNEFQQMSGRAGRRGIDAQGHVALPYSPWVTFHEALNIATGPLRPVESAFTMRYNSVLNLWDTPPVRSAECGVRNEEATETQRPTLNTPNTPHSAPRTPHSVDTPHSALRTPHSEGIPNSERVLRVMRSSLLQFQQNRRLRDLEAELEEAESALDEVPVGCLIGYEGGEELLDEYERLGRVLEETRRREKKAEQNLRYAELMSSELPWRRPEHDALRRAFRTMPQGATTHIEGQGWAAYLGRGLGAVVGLFLVVGDRWPVVSDGEEAQPPQWEIIPLTEYRPIDYLPDQPVMLELPYSLTTLAVPPTVPLDGMLTPEEMAALAESVRGALGRLPDLEEWTREHRAARAEHVEAASASAHARLQEVREEIQAGAQAEREHVCHTCPVRKEHRSYRRTRARLMLDRDAVEKRLSERRRYEETRLQTTLKGLTSVLVQFAYLRKGELTPKARKLADVFDTNALMVVEMVEGNYLGGLSATDLAEVFSWFAYDRDIDFPNRLLLPRYLLDLRRDLDSLQNAIFSAERRQDVFITRGYNPYFYGAARAWCKGTSIGDILAQVDMSEGDLVMTFNKTLDVMRQVREMLTHHDAEHPLRNLLWEADRLVRRGVVEMSQSLGFGPREEASSLEQQEQQEQQV